MKLRDLFKKKRKPDFRYKGHDFYVCDPNADGKEVNRLSTSRALIYAIALNQLEINLSREDLTKFVTEQEAMLRRGDLQNALFMNQMLKTRLQLKTFERGFIDLAKTIILVDDEQEPNNFFDSLKEELLKDEVVKGFFFAQCNSFIPIYEGIIKRFRDRGLFKESGSEGSGSDFSRFDLKFKIEGYQEQLNTWIFASSKEIGISVNDIMSMPFTEFLEYLVINKKILQNT